MPSMPRFGSDPPIVSKVFTVGFNESDLAKQAKIIVASIRHIGVFVGGMG